MSKDRNNKFQPLGGGKASCGNDFYDFATRHSEHSEKYIDLAKLDVTLSLVGEGRVRYEQPLTLNVINNHVIASPSGHGNPIKLTLIRISKKLKFQELPPLPSGYKAKHRNEVRMTEPVCRMAEGQ